MHVRMYGSGLCVCVYRSRLASPSAAKRRLRTDHTGWGIEYGYDKKVGSSANRKFKQ